MTDIEILTARNEQFIEACRQGSWTMLSPVMSPGFSYTDGATGEVWDHDRYVKDLEENPLPELTIDQVVVHVDGDTAIVSARTKARAGGRHNRYVDTYTRRDGEWLCVHATVWPLT